MAESKKSKSSKRKARIKKSKSDTVTDMVSKEKTEAMARNLAKSITELIETEEAYVKDLETMVEKIMKPMASKRDFMTGVPLVTKEQMECIWSNIALLPPVNTVLLHKMKEGLEKEGADSEKMPAIVGDAFLEVADYMQIYSQFCANQATSTATILQLQQNNQFEAFLMEKGDVCVMEESKNLNLNAFLIKPVQRVCKYPLFLRDLIGYMQSTHPGYETLLQAKEKISAVVQRINENKRNAENTMKLQEVASLLSATPEPIVQPGRMVAKYGQVRVIIGKKKTAAQGVLCVCNDVVMIGTGKATLKDKLKKSSKGKFKCSIFEKTMSCTVKSLSEATIEVTTPSEVFQILLETEEEKSQWMEAFLGAAESEKSKVLLRKFRRADPRPLSCSF